MLSLRRLVLHGEHRTRLPLRLLRNLATHAPNLTHLDISASADTPLTSPDVFGALQQLRHLTVRSQASVLWTKSVFRRLTPQLSFLRVEGLETLGQSEEKAVPTDLFEYLFVRSERLKCLILAHMDDRITRALSEYLSATVGSGKITSQTVATSATVETLRVRYSRFSPHADVALILSAFQSLRVFGLEFCATSSVAQADAALETAAALPCLEKLSINNLSTNGMICGGQPFVPSNVVLRKCQNLSVLVMAVKQVEPAALNAALPPTLACFKISLDYYQPVLNFPIEQWTQFPPSLRELEMPMSITEPTQGHKVFWRNLAASGVKLTHLSLLPSVDDAANSTLPDNDEYWSEFVNPCLTDELESLCLWIGGVYGHMLKIRVPLLTNLVKAKRLRSLQLLSDLRMEDVQFLHETGIFARLDVFRFSPSDESDVEVQKFVDEHCGCLGRPRPHK